MWQILVVFLGAFSVAFAANWLALIPWRRLRSAHWTEQARLLWPALRSAASNVVVIPAVLYLAFRFNYAQSTVHWLPLALVSMVGTILGNLPMHREVFSRYDSRKLLGYLATLWTLRLGVWLFFLCGIALMPKEFGWASLLIALIVLACHVCWEFGLSLKLLEALKFLKPATPRLRKIVQQTSARMQVQVKGVCLMTGPVALAVAFPTTKKLLFSERLLEIYDDDEISSVCAHELAHLTESRATLAGRLLGSLAIFPWLFIIPAIHYLGAIGFVLIALLMFAIIYSTQSLSLRMEKRADAIAKNNELNEGVYARVLEKLYRENLAPAVSSSNNRTHPHLYDRLLAAGIIPEYARPKAPTNQAWTGLVLSVMLAILVGLVIASSGDHRRGNAVADDREQYINSLPEPGPEPQSFRLKSVKPL